LAARSISETERVRYLLGLSLPAEREHIESLYFEDEDAFQEMLTAEDDLIDAYARGELTGHERQNFEKSLASSLNESRVQFARAFTDVISASRPAENKHSDTSLHIFKFFRSPGGLQIAMIALVIVFVAVLAWLVSDRRRTAKALGELRVESTKLSQRLDALLQRGNSEPTPVAETVAQPANPRVKRETPKPTGRGTIANQLARQLGDAKNIQEAITARADLTETLVNRSDATLGNTFVAKRITQLPLEARNVPNLLTLPTAITRGGYIAERPEEFRVSVDGDYHTYILFPLHTSSSGEKAIHIPTSLTWLRFHLPLETAATHEDYRIRIQTPNGRYVISAEWTEPLTPNQTFLDTPIIFTADLSSGDYVLLLMGKGPDGSFAKIAEYPFKVIKY
jgi:hypothetical protein